jgi:hypothetical protein
VPGVPELASFFEEKGFDAQETRERERMISINFFITDYNVIDIEKSNHPGC